MSLNKKEVDAADKMNSCWTAMATFMLFFFKCKLSHISVESLAGLTRLMKTQNMKETAARWDKRRMMLLQNSVAGYMTGLKNGPC